MKRVCSAIVLAAAVGLTASGCTSADESAGSGSGSGSVSPQATTSAASTEDANGEIVLGGTDLPEGWPPEVPAYDGGTVLSAVVLDDGGTVNASWASDEDALAAWTGMDTALREAGFTPVGELGEESQFVQDETQTTDTYRSDTFEVNVVVVPGEQTTVLVNASRLA